MRIIGLTGFAQSGKDTVASILVNGYGFNRIAFADPMREALLALNPHIIIEQPLSTWTRIGRFFRQYPQTITDFECCKLSEIIAHEGWDRAKVMYPEIRQLLQRFGTEVGRAQFGANFWIDTAFRKVQYPHNYVFSDCRFTNEAEKILCEGGEIWNVTRPNVGAVNGHISDKGLDAKYITRTIANDGTIEDLAAKVAEIVNSITT